MMASTGDELSGAWNFRDTAEETGIAPGRFFRSSELSGLDEAGRVLVARRAITDVADLRSARELERRGPGLVPDAVQIHLLPFRELGTHAPHEQGFEQLLVQDTDSAAELAKTADDYMIAEYRKYPALPGAQSAVRQLVSLLADGRVVLAHCFAGKDRTGFAVATVLEAAGVDRNAIMADYLRSNAAIPQLRESILESIRSRAAEGADEVVAFTEARLIDEVLGVRPEYLHAARQVIDDDHGSLAGYLQAIGVSPEQTSRLRDGL